MGQFIARQNRDESTTYRSRSTGKSYTLSGRHGCFFVSSTDAAIDVITSTRQRAVELISIVDRHTK